jgi:hypothetical protein
MLHFNVRDKVVSYTKPEARREAIMAGCSNLEYQIPSHKPSAQPNSPPKHSLRRTPSLSSTLQLPISLPDIRLRRIHIRNKLENILLLRSKMRNESFLQRRNLQQ